MLKSSLAMPYVIATIVLHSTFAFISAANSHCALKEQPGICPVGRYKIIDLGAPKLEAAQLSKLNSAYSLAPVINNFNLILYNLSDGAYLKDPGVGEYSLNIPGIKVSGHAINNNGEVIVSLKRPDADVEWMVWAKKTSPSKSVTAEKWNIGSHNPIAEANFSAINDKGTVIGFKKVDGKLKPLVWSKTTKLQQLGESAGYNIVGFPRAINASDVIVGDFKEALISSPMLWSPSTGLEIFRNYHHQLEMKGWIELSDMVIDQQGIVFGNYLLENASKDANPDDIGHHFLYRWNPETKDLKSLNIRDMRLASINSANTMVGSFKGRAAIYNEGQQPIDLNNQLINPEGKWELIEATAINDRGHIVGFGRHHGEMHLFLLEPIL